jgi:hypothetical protein
LPVTVAIRWSSLSIGESDEPMFLIVQTLVRFIPDRDQIAKGYREEPT